MRQTNKTYMYELINGKLQFQSDPPQLKLDFTDPTFAWVSEQFASMEESTACVGGNGCTGMTRRAWSGGPPPRLHPTVMFFQNFEEHAIPHGVSYVDGIPCNVWSVTCDGIYDSSACFSADGILRSLIVEADENFWGWSNAPYYSVNFTFANISTTGLVPVQPYPNPYLNLTHAGQVVLARDGCDAAPLGFDRSLRVMRFFSDPEPKGVLENRDTFDLDGILTFREFGGNEFLEVFDVSFDGRFSLWRDCNYDRASKKNKCSPNPLNSSIAPMVTRSSAEQLTAGAHYGVQRFANGMCDRNDLIGSWYTFPEEGKCANHTEVGQGCHWKLDDVKVISAECVKTFNNSHCYDPEKGETDKYCGLTPILNHEKAPFPQLKGFLEAAITRCEDVRLNRED